MATNTTDKLKSRAATGAANDTRSPREDASATRLTPRAGGAPAAPREWWEHHLNLAALFAWLDNEETRPEEFDSPEMVPYLEKPWHWAPEWEMYLATGGLDHNE